MMCAFGWLVTPIAWSLILYVWIYNLILMFVLSAVRIAAENFVEARSQKKAEETQFVNQALNK